MNIFINGSPSDASAAAISKAIDVNLSNVDNYVKSVRNTQHMFKFNALIIYFTADDVIRVST